MKDDQNILKDEFENLILDFLTHQLDEDKKRRLKICLEDAEYRRLFRNKVHQYRLVENAGAWEKINIPSAEQKVFSRLKYHRRISHVWGYAASLILLVGGYFMFFTSQPAHFSVKDHILAEQGNTRAKAVLTIEGKEKVVLYNYMDTVLKTSRESQILVQSDNSIRYGASKYEKGAGEPVIHTLSIPHGSEFCVNLPDGTRVWLNALSSLSYPEYFSKGLRKVKLSGEAYFEVAKDSTAPFEVETLDGCLRVLGTSFNVKSYPDDSKHVTTLISGKVREEYFGLATVVTLSPSQQVVYDREKRNYHVEFVNTKEALAWKNGKIIMKNRRLEDIFKELGRWYVFDITYQEKELKDMIFHLNVERYDDIRSVLKKMEMTNGVKFKIEGTQIVVFK